MVSWFLKGGFSLRPPLLESVQTLQVINIGNKHLYDKRGILYTNTVLKLAKPGRHKSCVQFNGYDRVNVCGV